MIHWKFTENWSLKILRNPLTFVVESSLGAVFISISAILFISLLFISIKNFNSDIDILTSDYSHVTASNSKNFISPFEKVLISNWINENRIKVPAGRNVYKYAIQEYPTRPWLEQVE